MMMRLCFGVVLALSAVNSYGALSYSDSAVQASVSNVSKYYQPVDIHPEDKQFLEYRKPSQKVEVIEGKDLASANRTILSKGYRAIGYSEFKDRKLPDATFIEQAKKVGALKVLVYKEGITEVAYSSYDDLNNLDYGYGYYVVFYVKDGGFDNRNSLGIAYDDIPIEKTKVYQRNTGAYVLSVVKGSKAYVSNILVDDVITAINNRRVLGSEDLSRIGAAELKKSKTLNFTITRIVNNEPREVQIPVSFN